MTRPAKLYRVELEHFAFAWSIRADFSAVSGQAQLK